MLFELIEGPSELLAGVGLEQFFKAAIAVLPDLLLCLSVFDPRNIFVGNFVT
jgi:hypothetical protein